jgi:hypothetical protein
MAKSALFGGNPIRNQPWTPFYPPYVDLVEKEAAAVTRVVRSRLLCAEYKGRRTGSIGHVNAFSFQ